MHTRRRGFDLTALTLPEKTTLEPALHACKFPTGRITNMSGATVPISVADLSRFNASLDVNGHGHAHEGDEHAHLLGEPVPAQSSVVTGRRAPLGLYWLPTVAYPAGRIEVGAAGMLARGATQAEVAAALGVSLTTLKDSL